jgi:hypothetical protein
LGVLHPLTALVPAGDPEAIYYPNIDCLFTNFDTLPDIWLKGIIVHEAIHAIFDRDGQSGMNRLTNECAAFAGQAMYYRLKGFMDTDYTKIPYVHKATAVTMFDAAFAVADYCLKAHGAFAELEKTINTAVAALPP